MGGGRPWTRLRGGEDGSARGAPQGKDALNRLIPASSAAETSLFSKIMSAAFFDLDKTVIAKSSTLAFGRPFY